MELLQLSSVCEKVLTAYRWTIQTFPEILCADYVHTHALYNDCIRSTVFALLSDYTYKCECLQSCGFDCLHLKNHSKYDPTISIRLDVLECTPSTQNWLFKSKFNINYNAKVLKPSMTHSKYIYTKH